MVDGPIGLLMMIVVWHVELDHKQEVENAIRQSHLMEDQLVMGIPQKQLRVKKMHV